MRVALVRSRDFDGFPAPHSSLLSEAHTLACLDMQTNKSQEYARSSTIQGRFSMFRVEFESSNNCSQLWKAQSPMDNNEAIEHS